MLMLTKPVHTLQARDNVMLEVLRELFDLSPKLMLLEIQALRYALENVLACKGVSYDQLKSALVPNRLKRDVAFFFDRMVIESGSYGYDVFSKLIPLLDRASNHSVLSGDYLGRSDRSEQLFVAFEEAVELRRNVEYKHSSQFYVVYINNLADGTISRLDEGLGDYYPYVGFADMSYMSRLKVYLSTMLVNSFIKHGKTIIQGHEPDRADSEDVNMRGYPFEESGYRCRSISSELMGVRFCMKEEHP